MKIRFTETALRELDDIFAYIYEQNRPAALAVVERIEKLSRLLGEFPGIGHPTDEPNVRVLPVVRYPFLIFYATNNAAEEIVVLHIRHGARLPPAAD